MATTHPARASERRQALQETDPRSLLRLRQVLALIPVSASSWWLGVRSGRFPRPIKLGPHTTAWRACDVLDLIDSLSSTEHGATGKAGVGRVR
jgi:predicted DNA-binding transcriptional regulator AlpA